MVEFDCEICGKHVRKAWSRSMPGSPRFCSWDCKSESQRRQKPVSKEWLEQKYVTEGMSANDIALLVGRNSKSVWNWLRDLGIPTRPRGSHPKSHFPKGVRRTFATRVFDEAAREKLRQDRKRCPNLPHLTGGVHYLKGKRGPEVHSWKGGLTPVRQKLYTTPEWRSVANQVWRREHGKCQRCGMGKKEATEAGVMLDIHHIVGFAVEALRCELSNLALLCEPCHYWVHSRKNVNREFLP